MIPDWLNKPLVISDDAGNEYTGTLLGFKLIIAGGKVTQVQVEFKQHPVDKLGFSDIFGKSLIGDEAHIDE